MNSSSISNPKGTRKPRFGCVKILIDTRHNVKGPDGQIRCFQVRDKSRLSESTKLTAVCLKCNKTYKSVDDLLRTHPSEQVMRKQEETHLYGWWSDDIADKEKPESPTNVVGLVSDLEWTRNG